MLVSQRRGPAVAEGRSLSAVAAALIALASACLPSLALGDDKPAAPKRASAGPAVALIDLKYVFEHDPGFAQAKADIDSQIKAAEGMVALRKASVEKLTQDRDKRDRGDGEYRRLDQLLTQEMAELKTQVEVWRAEFTKREAELYHQTYRRIQSTLDAYVEEHGILVVLRFQRKEVKDVTSATEVAELLNRPIVAYKKPADITDEILLRLEQARAQAVARQPKAPAKGATVPK
jgi:Skp family chaperone for outer membrane proteins